MQYSFVYFGGAALMLTQLYSLLYRYVLLQSDHRWLDRMMRLPALFMAQAVCLGLALPLGVLMYLVCTDSMPYLPDALLYWNITEQYPALKADPSPIYVFMSKNATVSVVLVLAMFVTVAGVELATGVTACAIFRLLRRVASKMSRRTYAAHRQFTLLLVVQLASPLFFLIIPAVVGEARFILHQGIPNSVGELGVLVIALYGCSNSLLTIVFVAPYWRYTLQRLQWVVPAVMPGRSRGGVTAGSRSTPISTVSFNTASGRAQSVTVCTGRKISCGAKMGLGTR